MGEVVELPKAGNEMNISNRKPFKLTQLDPVDDWLPITESRKGNAYYAAFHCLSSGIGVQALLLPIAFAYLGWAWGVIVFTLTFIWQFYTIYLLVELHESPETGVRYNRYLQIASATFGNKLSRWLTAFPLLYLSKGTCVALIIAGASSTKTFFNTVCGETCTVKSPTPIEWYLIFASVAVLLSQLPNLNSIAGVSLVATITGVGYITMLWMVSVTKGQIPRVSYDPLRGTSELDRAFHILTSLGIIAFAFRGHNVILEIQATMPSGEKHPSREPMWKGVVFAYIVIAMCLFPIAIGGYWAYGQKIPKSGGMLAAILAFHRKDTSQLVRGLISLFIVINALTSYQIYAMPVFDAVEEPIVKRMNRPCPWWLRAIIRTIVGYMSFFVAITIPFLGSFGGLLGGISLPLTLAYPCFMWLKIKKPKKNSPMWILNWALGLFGMALSGIVIVGSIYVIINTGIKWNFFKPK